MKFQNPQNGFVDEVKLEWLWTLIFGGLYLLTQQVILHGLLSLLLSFVTFGLSNIFYAIFAQRLIRKAYLKRGWWEVT